MKKSALALALLLIAAPSLAQETPPADPPKDEAVTGPKPLPYKLKKVCRPKEVVGSGIPRMICTTKRVLLKPGEKAEAENGSAEDTPSQL